MRKGSSRGTLQSQNWRQLVKQREVRVEELANGDVMDKPEIKHWQENWRLHKMRIWVKGKRGGGKVCSSEKWKILEISNYQPKFAAGIWDWVWSWRQILQSFKIWWWWCWVGQVRKAERRNLKKALRESEKIQRVMERGWTDHIG